MSIAFCHGFMLLLEFLSHLQGESAAFSCSSVSAVTPEHGLGVSSLTPFSRPPGIDYRDDIRRSDIAEVSCPTIHFVVLQHVFVHFACFPLTTRIFSICNFCVHLFGFDIYFAMIILHFRGLDLLNCSAGKPHDFLKARARHG